MFTIENLHADIEGKPILQAFSLHVEPGQIHAIMGPNGAGKSTLAKVLAGHPGYTVTEGSVRLDNEEILSLEPEERAHRGLFMSFQYPIEIPGVNNVEFLRMAYNAKERALGRDEWSAEAFAAFLDQTMASLGIAPSFKERNVNEGFSGGEKKRNEILQMALLNPKVAILDETDSGLDIDALRIVASGINGLMNKERGLILITHYQRLLDYIQPDFVHVMVNGRIVTSGDASLAKQLESDGYEAFAGAA